MELIPVIDLMQGQAVLARGGRREEYRPLHSSCCSSSDPLAVIESFLARYSFKVVYLADLDAILKQGDNGIIIKRIRRRFPWLTLWLDCGWPPYPATAGLVPVIGSESLSRDWPQHLSHLPSPWILSLDFSAEKFLGPEDLLHCSHAWPGKVIVMSLNRVGESTGPDWERLRRLTQQFPAIDWIAAGGIRNLDDLIKLEDLNVRQALVATALHQGTLPPVRQRATPCKGGS